MGRGAIQIPRAKFHMATDVVALFEGRPVPEHFAKNAWWHFVSVTVTGGESELLTVYDQLLSMLHELRLADFPIVESRPELLDDATLTDLARLWPPLVENTNTVA